MRLPRIAIVIAAVPLLFAACDRTPTTMQAPPSARYENDPPPPPPPDTTGRGGGFQGSGG